MPIERPQISDEAALKVLDVLVHRLGERIQKHGKGAFLSVHEAFGVYEEEHWELVEAVRDSKNLSHIAEEYFDVAVAAVWAVASMLGSQPANTGEERLSVSEEEFTEQDKVQEELKKRAEKAGILISSDLI